MTALDQATSIAAIVHPTAIIAEVAQDLLPSNEVFHTPTRQLLDLLDHLFDPVFKELRS